MNFIYHYVSQFLGESGTPQVLSSPPASQVYPGAPSSSSVGRHTDYSFAGIHNINLVLHPLISFLGEPFIIITE